MAVNFMHEGMKVNFNTVTLFGHFFKATVLCIASKWCNQVVNLLQGFTRL